MLYENSIADETERGSFTKMGLEVREIECKSNISIDLIRIEFFHVKNNSKIFSSNELMYIVWLHTYIPASLYINTRQR